MFDEQENDTEFSLDDNMVNKEESWDDLNEEELSEVELDEDEM